MRQFSASAASTANSTALPVEHRQRAGQPEAHRADVGVRRIAEVGGAAAEDLGLGQQLDVDFESDDRLVLRARRNRRFRSGGHVGIIARRKALAADCHG